MREKSLIEIDPRTLQATDEKAAASGRSAAGHAAAVLGRDIHGDGYYMEVIVHKDSGRGALRRSQGESDEDYEARKNAVRRLLSLKDL